MRSGNGPGSTVPHNTCRLKSPLECIRCRGPLEALPAGLQCARCGSDFPVAEGIADFSEGRYYDVFDPSHSVSDAHRVGLENEETGAVARIRDFFLPLIQRSAGSSARAMRVLDSGCGNGISVDLLSAAGVEAWGHDLSALRKWQWRERRMRERLVVADAVTLPFPDGFFDLVISSGVIEHIGVVERGNPRYSVTPLAERDALRAAYLRELLRVVGSGGRLIVDCPNGAFPIDFWHGDKAGGARWHSPREGFLPTFGEVQRLARKADKSARAVSLSARGRLRFQQVGAHWYGRLFAIPMAVLLRAMEIPGFRWLARSPLNPYLVIEIERRK
jgi:SAM-dependent methyltransferase